MYEEEWRGRLVLDHGCLYESEPLCRWPGHALGAPRECYRNAYEGASTDPRITYVEGFAASRTSDPLSRTSGWSPVGHAWCVDATGRVLDRTPSWHRGNALWYLGIPFETSFVTVLMSELHGEHDGIWRFGVLSEQASAIVEDYLRSRDPTPPCPTPDDPFRAAFAEVLGASILGP